MFEWKPLVTNARPTKEHSWLICISRNVELFIPHWQQARAPCVPSLESVCVFFLCPVDTCVWRVLVSSCREVVVLHIVFTASTELKFTYIIYFEVYIYFFFSMYRKGSNIMRIKKHFSCEIEYFVETRPCKLVCDTPIARITGGVSCLRRHIGRRLPLQLQCSYQGQQGDVIYRRNLRSHSWSVFSFFIIYDHRDARYGTRSRSSWNVSECHLSTLAMKLGITLSRFWYHS